MKKCYLALVFTFFFFSPLMSLGKIPLLISTDFAAGVAMQSERETIFADVDDALAITTLLNQPQIHILGVVTQFGNASSKSTYAACKSYLAIKAAKLPVVSGADSKIAQLDAVPLTPGAIFMAKELAHHHASIIAMGPLTDVASLITHYPQLHQHIKRVIAEIGQHEFDQFDIGRDHHLLSDFNFIQDPLAAKIVLDSAIPITLVGLSAVKQITLHRQAISRIARRKDNAAMHWLIPKMNAWDHYWERTYQDNGIHPWDAVLSYYVMHPEAFDCENASVNFLEKSHWEIANGPLSQLILRRKEERGQDKNKDTRTIHYCYRLKAEKLQAAHDWIVSNVW